MCSSTNADRMKVLKWTKEALQAERDRYAPDVPLKFSTSVRTSGAIEMKPKTAVPRIGQGRMNYSNSERAFSIFFDTSTGKRKERLHTMSWKNMRDKREANWDVSRVLPKGWH